MKHFHGTPISGTKVAQAQVLKGRFAFIPWKAPGALPMAMEVCRGFAVDNSAFSFWSNGETPDWMDYIKWVKTFARHPRFEFAIVPDVIDGDEKQNDELLKMWDRHCWNPLKVHGCPVWHLHESLERLERLCNGRWPIVALGSSGQWPTPGVDDWWHRMADAFEVICDPDGQPKCRIHGLRMLRDDIVRSFPFYSCDSTNAAQNGARNALRYGMSCPVWGANVTADRIESHQSPATWTRATYDTQGFLEWDEAVTPSAAPAAERTE